MAEKTEPRIGVFLCHCGTNIAGSLSIDDVVNYAKTLPYVAIADQYQYMCSTPGQKKIDDAIKEHNLTGVVVAACSPRLHEPTFRTATKEGGLNPFRFEMANIREQNSWVHMHGMWDEATEKAKDQVRMAVAKATMLEDLIPKSVPVEPTAMVVGAGVAGIQAALDLASAGIKTYLVERTPTVGGRMSQLDKTFPTLDCSQCILTPKMVDVGRHPNIELLTYHEVETVEGYIGNFEVTLRKKARGVLTPTEATAKGIVGGGCNGCGDCAGVCPVIKPNPFEMGMAPRKAIYIYHAQVMPLIYTVDFDSCVKCGLCVEACGEKKAIDLEMQDEFVKYKVGTAILATGYELFPVENKREWGYKQFDNVINALEFERLICASGPTGGHLVRPSDGKTPMKVGFVLCAGSRDNTGIGKPYCSRFCCMYSLKHAHQIMEKIPGAVAYLFYMDIRSFGKMYEEFYYRIQHEGAKFIRGRVANVLEDPATKNLHVYTEDTLLGRPVDVEVDLLVLAAAAQPNEGANVLRKKFGVSASQDGWMLEAHPKLNPCGTTTAGVFLAGVCQGPKDIPDAVAQAEGAASAASIPIHMGKVELEPYFAMCIDELCAGCGMCVNLCPYSALALGEKDGRTVMVVTEAKCKGCGTCGGFCPGGAIKMQHFTTPQIAAQIDAFFAGGEQ
ncbi:CoB--CoM heterodisulfide reductase iron-sulfur subunit A family protein [Methanospirillum sp. J.3.6.1-F.2.7.3]|uniref:CoB--CoM heterodisulfide reductase iron-sulfur subunit A n=1 Tax=Methanospirillum purgamenti TaxID=2834276 RepID=A0A8E7AYP2_9EURY|nr:MULTISPECIES: CoB--CoM heterodisulfide reductase iron-sulfur subunit A family protein [Methanospirillum]MDX8551443.1 CoB--CoM heterodisulfide reductase iron-sulfur subunit A family protein [Methanospirillum hungatei]QVV89900.1 CoB--CoM heterodisulfide reductase iron-sulfur subunit A family protein [Methanospirillum sp. J.3.6.1-F.2.7.3]